MSYWHVDVWIWIRNIFIVLLYYLCSYEESHFLVSWCAGGRCDMADSDEDHDRSMRPDAEDQWWSSIGRILSGRVIGRSGNTVYGLHHTHEDEEHRFFGLASKSRSTVFRFGPQNRQLRFGDLDLKITATVSYFMPQNQASFGLSVVSQNWWREVSVGHTSRSSGLLRYKASLVMIS
jgi:hypothetical protein